MMMKHLLAVLACLLPCATLAEDANGKFAVDGVGARTCADLTTAAASGDDRIMAAFASWTDGFITATNVTRPATFDLTPWQTVEVVLAKMQAYCGANPDEAYIFALGKLISVLDQTRLQAASELVSVRHGDKAVFLYRAVLEDIRAALIGRGAQITPTEGTFDQTFIAALAQFQKSQGLPETGLPDQPTLIALLD